MGAIFNAVSYVTGWVLIVLMALCIACGMYYAAELAEEYTVLTKKILKWSVVGVEVLHVLMWIDGFPFSFLLVGVLCHALYAMLLQDFPFIELGSPKLILSVIAVFINHYCWFHFFMQVHFQPLQVLGFITTMVWFIPFGLFVSTSVNENTLPSGESQAAAAKKMNVFIGLYDFSRRQVERIQARMFPNALPGLGKEK